MQGLGRTRWWQRLSILVLLIVITAGPIVMVARADDTVLNGAHWARRGTPFTLRVGDNVSRKWTTFLDKAADQWTNTGVVKMRVVNGQAGQGSDCSITNGRVEVCSGDYGRNNWLGLSRIQLTNDRKHITGASVRLNDYYFKSGRYDDPKARQHTICHELGHTIGLDHVTYKSCMNDSNRSVFRDTKPATKDKRKLKRIYAHNDRKSAINGQSGLPATTEEITVEEMSDGTVIVEIITWIDEDSE